MQQDRTAADVTDRLRAAYEAGKAAVRHFDAEAPPRKEPEPRPQLRADWHH